VSHPLAAECTVCGVVDDPICPECHAPAAALHGIAHQNPFRSDLVYSDGTRHEWHPDCMTATTPPTDAAEAAGDEDR
jgi:hypothetical protein